MNRESFDIVITSNSPGELYSLVRPAVRALSLHIPEARIILVITPCQYASGREIEVARSFPEIYEVVFPHEFKKWMFRDIPPKGLAFSKKGAVLFMGGDLMNGVMLSKKLGFPACAYTMNRLGWAKEYNKFLVPDKKTADRALKKIPHEKVRIVGDLMIDAAAGYEPQDRTNGSPAITFMPGSRPAHIKFMAPFFLKAADLIIHKNKDLRLAFGLSPYASTVMLEDMLDRKKMGKKELREGVPGRLIARNGKRYILSEKGTEVLIIDNNPYEAMAYADLIVTIPGTNTAEAAAMGKPMLVAVPFNKPEVYIFDGLVGIIGNAPLIGRHIKKAAIAVLNRTVKYIALPNRKAGAMVVPELRGVLDAEDIAEKAVEMMADPEKLNETGATLKKIMGSPGAADRIAEEIAELT